MDSKTIKKYYYLTKPGIIYGNVMTAAAGFLLASRWHIAFGLAAATLGGMALVIAAACVCNNYIDQGIDRKMARTSKRALVRGTISGRSAIVYAACLGVLGFFVLSAWTNSLVVVIGLVAFVDYVVLYGVAKRRSPWGTIVGSVSGSAPLVSGYCAVTNRFDVNALILFLIMTCWQMPHFYAIAMYRMQDYKAASLPVLPIKRGLRTTKIRIVAYVIAFVLACTALSIFGMTGYTFVGGMLLVGGAWLYRGLIGFHAPDDAAWARKMFFSSLLVLVSLSVLLTIGPLLP